MKFGRLLPTQKTKKDKNKKREEKKIEQSLPMYASNIWEYMIYRNLLVEKKGCFLFFLLSHHVAQTKSSFSGLFTVPATKREKKNRENEKEGGKKYETVPTVQYNICSNNASLRGGLIGVPPFL